MSRTKKDEWLIDSLEKQSKDIKSKLAQHESNMQMVIMAVMDEDADITIQSLVLKIVELKAQVNLSDRNYKGRIEGLKDENNFLRSALVSSVEGGQKLRLLKEQILREAAQIDQEDNAYDPYSLQREAKRNACY